jgi:hypothetical protein
LPFLEATVKLRFYATLLALPGLIFLAATPLLAADADESNVDGKIKIGYRAVSTDGNPGRAAEYSFLESSPTLGLDSRGGSGTQHFIFEGIYLNENDYSAEVHYDQGGLVRFDLRSQRFFHNLDHVPYAPGVPGSRGDADGEASTSDGAERIQFEDQDPGEDYGVRLDTNEAHFRGKLKAFPAHLNLRYWRFEKKGDRQLRFVDEGWDDPDFPNPVNPTTGVPNTCNVCHMQSKTRDIDRVTDEFTASVDAHLGPIDLIVEQLFREFRDREPIPVDTFGGHSLRPAGQYQHDENPDARLTETTFKVHTSLSGGVIGAASFTIGKRENRSDLAAGQPFGVDGVSAETDYYKASGDLTYIPSPQWTFNFRYRLLDLDADNSDRLAAYGDEYLVRESVDLRRSSHEAMIAYRPSRNFTLKGEYQLENLHRGNTGGPEVHHGFSAPIGSVPMNIDDVWELPEEEVLQRFKVGLLARALDSRALKVNLWYQYRTSDDPAYAASYENRHEVFFGSTYSPSNFWGINLTAKALAEENDRHKEFLFENDIEKLVELDREREQQDFSLGFWANPISKLSAGLNYAFMRSRIRQDLLFGNDLGNPIASPDPIAAHAIVDELVEYSQRVHTVSANASVHLLEELILRVDGYHIRSFAEFSPGFFVDAPPLDFPASSAGLKEQSRLDIRQNGLSAGLDWAPAPSWTYSLRYTFDDYEDRDASAFDGTVQTYIASVSRFW